MRTKISANVPLNPPFQSVAVVCTDAALCEQARCLARQLGLTLSDELPQSGCLFLRFDQQGLALCASGKNVPGPLRVDFAAPALSYRQRDDRARELLAKAIGVGGQHRPLVWDVTAGLGQDAWILAALGCEVWMLERHPIVHALLADGLRRAADSERTLAIAARLQLSHRDSIDALTDTTLAAPDIVYLDPMFPEKRKQARAKKAMQYLQRLVGESGDDGELLTAALQRARFRVIVKRPLNAAPLSVQKPANQLLGKTVRFDIYAQQSVQRYLEEKNNHTR